MLMLKKKKTLNAPHMLRAKHGNMARHNGLSANR